MRTETFGGLTARIVGGADGNGGGDGPVVVLLHGFGAPGTDLVGIGSELIRAGIVANDVRFVFPAAPIELDMGFGESRAWWMIDIGRMQSMIMRGQMRSLALETPVGLDVAHAKLVALLDEVEAKLGVTGEKIVLGGFSQGAMLSADVALRTDRKLAGLALISGSIICEDAWKKGMAARRGLPVFQSHGRFDPILPYAIAEQLSKELTQAGLDAELVAFGGGHEIDRDVLLGFARFLGRAFAAKPAST